MFVLNKSGTYSWPISFSIPSDGGKQEKKSFEVIFKRLPQSRIKEILKKVDLGEMGDNDFCKEVVTGWSNIKDEDENELLFSDETLEELLDFPQLAKKIVITYMESLDGAKVKN